MLRDTPIILAKKWGGLENASHSHWGIDLMNLHDDIAIGLPLLQGPLLWGLFLHRNLCWLYDWTSGAWSIRIFGGQAAIWDHCQGCRDCHCWLFSSSSCGLILCSQAMMEQTVWTQSFFAGVFSRNQLHWAAKLISAHCVKLSLSFCKACGLWPINWEANPEKVRPNKQQFIVSSQKPKRIPNHTNTIQYIPFLFILWISRASIFRKLPRKYQSPLVAYKMS